MSMIDLHSHFLYGIDDGADDLEMTRNMLRQAQSAGIEYLLATPHINERITKSDEETIKNRFEETRQVIHKENLDIEVDLAGEVDYNANVFNWLDHGWILFGKGKKNLLFEIPLFNLPVNFQDMLFQITVKGITPILAHPERNIHIQQKPAILLEWIRHGCLIQLNAGSILGRFGEKCRQLCHRMLKAQVVTLISSDAHDLDNRDFIVMKDAFELVSGAYGLEYAQILFKTNAERLIENGDIHKFEIDPGILNLSISRKIFRKLLNDGRR